MTTRFEEDPYPGKPKILFVGLAESTHTHAWINLLSGAELNVRLFALPSGCPPQNWWVRTYITSLCNQKNSTTCKNLYSGIVGTLEYFIYKLGELEPIHRTGFFQKVFHSFYKWYGFINRVIKWRGSLTPEDWLGKVVRQWNPDIIHTLGLFDNQGGMFYFKVRKAYQLEGYGKWILQLRGGSDLTLRRHDLEYIDQIRQVLSECYQIISDNRINIEYAKKMGISEDKFAPIVPVPGTGGVDVDLLTSSSLLPSSKRERIILWPKAYESPWSKALPVLDAIQRAWPRIYPCKIQILAMTPEMRSWFLTLPENIKQHCQVYGRIPRDQVLDLMRGARVLLAPSLVDGVPNTLYEAMACGAYPIVSPLETILSVVENEKNVLFAKNLYPDEIASVLERAMNDDKLVDEGAQNNYKLVNKIANRTDISRKVISYYETLLFG